MNRIKEIKGISPQNQNLKQLSLNSKSANPYTYLYTKYD